MYPAKADVCLRAKTAKANWQTCCTGEQCAVVKVLPSQKHAWKDVGSFQQVSKHKHHFLSSSTTEGNAEDQMLSMQGTL